MNGPEGRAGAGDADGGPAEIVIRTLGRLEIEVAGAILDATRSERLLLARLALAGGQVVSAAQLIDAIWPDRPPSTARNRIQVLVSGLRRKLAAASRPLLEGQCGTAADHGQPDGAGGRPHR